jgi:transposase
LGHPNPEKYHLKGADALLEGKRTGAPTRLSADQLTELVTELKKGPEQHGFQGAIWTRPRVNAVIKKLFGISYDPS